MSVHAGYSYYIVKPNTHLYKALRFRRYSTASDVWSYGVVMYEVWSLGHKPFADYDNLQVTFKEFGKIKL